MSKIASLKKKIANNLPTILTVTGVVVASGIIATISISTFKQVVENARVNAEYLDYLNDGLESGALTTIVDEATGFIHIVESTSL